MKRAVAIAVFVFLAVLPVLAGGPAAAQGKKPLIQLAILLDTSNSMDGLIVQAKAQIWKIVNEFAAAKRSGQRPDIQVALFEYGNDGLSSEKGFIRMVLPLTNDLDKVSEELFALKTNGGSEYCGQVIEEATGRLNWSKDSNDLKVIVIAGNEPFDQGSVDYRKSCKAAIARGIVVNTIHCGSYEEGERTGWKDGAVLADGRYMHIDQDRAVVHIEAPQDKDIARLGTELNETYIPYGSAGAVAAERQAVQDSNAASVSAGSLTNRAVFKAQSQYRNDAWDLVDAVNNKSVKLEDVKEADLPENLRKMSADERRSFIEKQTKRRADLQQQIKKLDAERQKFVALRQKELQDQGVDTLDSAMIKAMREQAEKKKFEFGK